MKKIILLASIAAALDISSMQPNVSEINNEKKEVAQSGGILQLLDDFAAICKTNGADFNVHKFDAFVTKNFKIITDYLEEHSSLETSMELHQIEADMLQVIKSSDEKVAREYDLSQKHLERAFYVLQNVSQHKTLIPIFRQIYTFVITYKPSMKEFLVYSFLSNVNKFKGSECFPGYRNRMIVNLLQAIPE